MQYLLYDPVLTGRVIPGDGGFTSGLLYVNGKPKPALRRLPPAAVPPGHLDAARTVARGVGVRAAGALRDPRRRRSRRRRRSSSRAGVSSAFTTLRTVTIGNPNNCYFDVRMKFPGSGTVRLAYTYPIGPLLLSPPALGGSTVYSRSVAIKLR